MLEILQFIFSSFWIWLGTVVLLISITDVLASTLRLIIFKVHK